MRLHPAWPPRLLLVGLAAVSTTCTTTPTIRQRLGEFPFLTPRDAPATVAMRDGSVIGADPASCGSCHSAVYAEWQAATHAAAATDLQYLAELAKPTSPRWLCLNCHSPTAPQRPEHFTLDTHFRDHTDITRLVSAPNPAFDTNRRAEGVGCPTCHVRRDADGSGVVVGPRGGDAAPHRVRVDRAALDGVCVECHSPGADIVVTPQFFCWFQTAEELATGPEAATPCVDCHMPRTVRPVAVGGSERETRRHLWAGGGVPKDYAAYAGLLERDWSFGAEVLSGVEAGEFRLRLHNRAGHGLPTGDPERHLRVEVRFEGADGEVRGQSQRRIGQRWDWGDVATARPARRLADERIPAGGQWEWSVPVPAGADFAVVEIAHVRMTVPTANSLAETALDAELVAVRPDAPALLSQLARVYPLGSFVYRSRTDLRDGSRVETTTAALLAESAAMQGVSDEVHTARFGVD